MMNQIPKYILVFFLAFFTGSIATLAILMIGSHFKTHTQLNKENKNTNRQKTIRVESSEPFALVEIAANYIEKKERSKPLEKNWINKDIYKYGDYKISRNCVTDAYDCRIRLTKRGKLLTQIDAEDKSRLKFGFFNFLGSKNKQLILFGHQGGTCPDYTYLIFDLIEAPSPIYNSRIYKNLRNHINFELKPIDIDQDGIFEFRQVIHTFDFFYSSHADSVYPTVVFGYNKQRKRFELANRKFSKYLLNEMQSDYESFNFWDADKTSLERKYFLRKIFLSLVYSGKRRAGWKFYRENYDLKDKDLYEKEVEKEFEKDPIYQLLYG